MASETVELRLSAGEPLSFCGSVQLSVLSGCVCGLGYDFQAAPGRWHTLHSPAGGLVASLQSTSLVSSGARVLIRCAHPTAVAEAESAPSASGKQRRGGKRKRAQAKAVAAAEAEAAAEEEEEEGLALAATSTSDEDDEDADAAADELAAAAAAPSGTAAAHGASLARLGLRPLPLDAACTRLGSVVPPDWESAVESLARAMAGSAKPNPSKKCKGGASGAAPPRAAPPVVLLCGARNQGKSSFARLLINRALADGPVRFLECDIGQSELSPPGMISLHTVSEPLLGASAATFRERWLGGLIAWRRHFLPRVHFLDRPAAHAPAPSQLGALHRRCLAGRPPDRLRGRHRRPP